MKFWVENRKIILYSAVLGLITFALKALEAFYFNQSLKLELFLGIIATIFMVLGLGAGYIYFQSARAEASSEPPPVDKQAEAVNLPPEFEELSEREFEVLELIAQGYSNQEIADKLFLSIHTVKTHTSRLFVKLDVKRRTQAVQKARELNLIPF